MSEIVYKGKLVRIEIIGDTDHSEKYNLHGNDRRKNVHYKFNAEFSVEVEGKRVKGLVEDIRDLPEGFAVSNRQNTIIGRIAPIINKLYEENYSERNHEFELIHRKNNEEDIWDLDEGEKETIGKLLYGIPGYFTDRGWTEDRIKDIVNEIVENGDKDYIHDITTYLKGKGIEY